MRLCRQLWALELGRYASKRHKTGETMDSWLTDEIKELLYQPCLESSGFIGRRLENRRRMRENIDERALTEDFVDLFDTRSGRSAWSIVAAELRDRKIYLNTSVRKSTREYETGADIGLIIKRQVYQDRGSANARYAVLIQCKKVNNEGYVGDFFHEVRSSSKRQSALMLDITPSAFYFIFTPPSLVETVYTIEPMVFASAAPGCSSPVWNMGCFGFDSGTFPFLTAQQKAAATGILVVPALAVEAQEKVKGRVSLRDILPNSLPFWYWFGELLIPGFIGDFRDVAISVASNTVGANLELDQDFRVRFSVELNMGNG